MTLSAEEFLRRFVQHVLPKGFVKIRHYGLLANRQREEKLAMCRRLLLLQPLAATLLPPSDVEQVQPTLPQRCPQCGGSRLLRSELPKEGIGAASQRGDTS